MTQFSTVWFIWAQYRAIFGFTGDFGVISRGKSAQARWMDE